MFRTTQHRTTHPRRTSLVIRSIWIPGTFLFFNFWQSLHKLLVGKPLKSNVEKLPIKVIYKVLLYLKLSPGSCLPQITPKNLSMWDSSSPLPTNNILRIRKVHILSSQFGPIFVPMQKSFHLRRITRERSCIPFDQINCRCQKKKKAKTNKYAIEIRVFHRGKKNLNPKFYMNCISIFFRSGFNKKSIQIKHGNSNSRTVRAIKANL